MSPLFDVWVRGESDEARSARLTRARTLCCRCPVAAACRAAAGEHDASGIWGGELYGDAGRPKWEVA
ncbi:WhiB family transcriptional regulator [Rhodococcus sp. CX]|nr:WhiB family transcriptional regulator [Rhodococcus sp. CX]